MLNNKDNKQTSETNNNYFSSPPAISLPKGGGAIKGIGEKFTANPVTGTGSMSVPIVTSPGRSGFGPQLSLSYDSGAGNDIFGFGWNSSIPSIIRKTDKGIPRYFDAGESDIFILSGAEDLVPILVQDTGENWVQEILPLRNINGTNYRIQRYRPRIEGLFARIERWTNLESGETHWRSLSKDNITTLYGKTAESQIVDPNDSNRIFSWLICESYDDKGNAIRYEYKPENSDEIDIAQVHERNRNDNIRSTNRYLKRIKYGNQTPRQTDEDLSLRTDWMFEVVFDYGEHDSENPMPNDVGIWSVRNDPFSSYRAGFEVRTYRLCQRVLMFHHFPEEEGIGQNCLVRSTNFTYSYEENPTDARNPIYSKLISVTQTGYKRNSEGGYIQKSLPPLEFTYSEPEIDETVQDVDPDSLENLSQGLDGTNYQWVDLDGEGLSGILTEQGSSWFYKRNLSPISTAQEDGQNTITAKFAPIELIASQPATALANGAQFLDLAGDGQLDLVTLRSSTPGFYERTPTEAWEPFIPFKSLLVLDWNNPNLKFIDLNGDGHSDILITEDDCFVWHPSLAEEGFGAAERSPQPWDEEKGPRVVFADSTQSIYLADFSGDGLTDIVRIRNGEVCYWPNLGYGRFGAKVTMDNSPWFDTPDIFNQRRIVLADIDGSGTTDILYLSSEGVQVYFNQSGNSWSAKQVIGSFPALDSVASVTAIDLLGNGTACLVWSSPLPGNAPRTIRYIDLMGGQKPHLLTKTVNNLGAQTIVDYAPSTKFYLQDKFAGQPWITKLPFLVHVVERVETYDHISHNRFVTRYAYHHGYFDGVEREFRGFGMVEQWDTEEFAVLSDSDEFPVGENIDIASHIPPVHTKTWFHTGVYVGRNGISNYFAGLLNEQDTGEYYREPGLTDDQARQLLLDDTVLPDGLTVEEEREACRALKGSMLRQEVYALDGTEQAEHPYTIAEQNFTIRVLQHRGDNSHGVFFTHAREAINYYYERNPEDPRIAHQMTLEVDEFGNVTKSIAIAYPRRTEFVPNHPQIQAAQSQTLITYTEVDVINRSQELTYYRLGVPVETRVYELTGLTSSSEGTLFSIAELLEASQSATEIAYEEIPTQGVWQKRLIERDRILYASNTLIDGRTQALPLGELESLALPHESYRMAFTPGLLESVYGNRINAQLLSQEGRYVLQDGVWWIPSGQQVFDAQRFYLPVEVTDPFGHSYRTTYDDYGLLAEQTVDPLDNTVNVVNDYRLLQPWQITDPNGNRTQVAFDVLGMVVGTAVMGKISEIVGDSLSEFEADLDEATLTTHINSPLDNPQEILGTATTRLVYDLWRYFREGQPPVVYTLARETHESELAPGQMTQIQHSFLYSDGLGRELMTKIQAEPGLAPSRNSETGELVLVDGAVQLSESNPRWVGTGRTIYDNKGNPVKQYEPFFSQTHTYEDELEVVEWGVTPILHYDPLGRNIRTDLPDGTLTRVAFNPWQQQSWDQNDTVLESQWYEERQGLTPSNPQHRAANLAVAHGDTPGIVHLDVLGRTFLGIEDNGNAGQYETHTQLDIEGNPLVITDARNNPVMSSRFDLSGNEIYSHSMDAGERWGLNNVAGNPIRGWNSREYQLRYVYDALQRPIRVFMGQGEEGEILTELMVYGENHPNATALNLRGQVFQGYDSSGVVTSEGYDFKGNPLSTQRQITREYRQTMDWSALANETEVLEIPANAQPFLSAEVFTASTTYDALNRPISSIGPDNSEARPTYNEANLLERLEVRLRGAAQWTTFVENIDYNEKGQRTRIDYGNGVLTEYSYNPLTFRLSQMRTTRGVDSAHLQDLRYTYDPVGNIAEIRDEAQQTIFFDNAVISPSSRYEYDALYRLIRAEGREHIGQTTNNLPEHRSDLKPHFDFNDITRRNLAHPHNGQAMGNYVEEYEYDAVGNIMAMLHQANGGNWTRRYDYATDSNRLRSTSLPSDLENAALPERYLYDAHGNMTQMPHLPLMQWDFKDQLQASSKQVVNNGGTPEITYYVYDAGGQRVRKVTERQAAEGVTPTRMKERLYLGGFEIYREYGGDGVTLTLERETLHVMDDQQRISLVETKTVDVEDGSGLLSPVIRYQLSNHLGSASLELDGDGAVISYEEYYPYGTTAYQAGRSVAEVGLKRYRYTGMERDEETGLGYHGARYYILWLGKWVSADPSGLGDGINLYVYVQNRPIVFHDPIGMASTAPPNTTPSKTFITPVSSGMESILSEFTNRELRDLGVPFEDIIRMSYMIAVSPEEVDTTDRSIRTIRKMFGLPEITYFNRDENRKAYQWRDKRPDIINITKKIWFEVKPNSDSGYVKGNKKVEGYNAALVDSWSDKDVPQPGLDPRANGSYALGNTGVVLVWKNTKAGLIQYDLVAEKGDRKRAVRALRELYKQAQKVKQEKKAKLQTAAEYDPNNKDDAFQHTDESPDTTEDMYEEWIYMTAISIGASLAANANRAATVAGETASVVGEAAANSAVYLSETAASLIPILFLRDSITSAMPKDPDPHDPV